MDSSKITEEVAVPKIIPLPESMVQKFKRAKRVADKKRRKKQAIRKINWDNARR